MSTEKDLLTVSLLTSFKNCRRKAKLRYIDHLKPPETVKALYLGEGFHAGLRVFHVSKDLGLALEHVSNCLLGSEALLVRAMLQGYVEKHGKDGLDDILVEKVFRGPILNPQTGRVSRLLDFGGKIDRIVRQNGRIWLMETKTTSRIDGAYLEKLWTDYQTLAYVYAAQKYLSLPIAGVIYDVALKSGIEQGKGETEEEFEERRAALIAKSKSGKSTAKQWVTETDTDFSERLTDWYRTHEAFHREELLISDDRLRDFETELWDLHLEYLKARREGKWYQNTSHCFVWNRRCSYFPICRSGGNPTVVSNFYEVVPPHEELLREEVEVF